MSGNSQQQFRHDNLTRNRCPECGEYMPEVNGKRGRVMVCSRPLAEGLAKLDLNKNKSTACRTKY